MKAYAIQLILVIIVNHWGLVIGSNGIDTCLAFEYFSKAKELSVEYEYDLAIEFYRKAAKEFDRAGFPDRSIRMERDIGGVWFSRGYPEIGLPVFQKGYQKAITMLGNSHPLTHELELNLGTCHRFLLHNDSAIFYYKRCFNFREQFYGKYSIETANVIRNLGYIYGELGDRKMQNKMLREAIEIHSTLLGDFSLDVVFGYNELGFDHLLAGEYMYGKTYLEKATSILDSISPDKPVYITPYLDLAFCHCLLGDSVKTIHTIKKGLRLFDSIQNKPIRLQIRVLIFAAKYAMCIGNYDLARKLIKSVAPLAPKETHPVYYLNILNLTARVLAWEGNIVEARQIWTRVLEIYYSGGITDPYLLSNCEGSIGKLDVYEGNYHEAIVHFDNAISSLRDFQSYADLSARKERTRSESWLDFLSLKFKALLQIPNKSEEDQEELERTFDSFELNLLKMISSNIESASTAALLKKFQVPVDMYLDYCFDQESDNENTVWKWKMLKVVEGFKSIILNEAMARNSLHLDFGVPLKALSDESRLRKRKVALEKEILISKSQPENGHLLDSLKDIHFRLAYSLDSLRQQYFDSIAKYKLEYHDFTSILNDQLTITGIPRGQCIIEFYFGESFLYTFSFFDQSMQVFREEYSKDLIQQLNRFSQLSSSLPKGQNCMIGELEEFTFLGGQLYDQLLKEVIGNLPKEIDHLIIIPDGPLFSVNFELLLTNTDFSGDELTMRTYRFLPYLLHDYSIHYAYSLNHLLLARKRATEVDESKHDNLFCGFAPSYQPQMPEGVDSINLPFTYRNWRNGSHTLPGAQHEVIHLAHKMDGKAFLGENATESTFKELSGNYKILHLAMHAEINPDHPQYSRMLFNGKTDSLSDGTLEMVEIYTHPIKAEMVVLSACQTGIGEFQRGLGMASLASSFVSAGSPSVVMSLWNVPDNKTPELMDLFYENLLKGNRKSDALRDAKLEFLRSEEDPFFYHPAFWGGFIVLGEDRPIQFDELENRGRWEKYMVLVAVFLLACLILFKSRNWFGKRNRSINATN